MLDCADLFVLLTQVVNDLYTIILTEKQTLSDIGEVTVAKQIITSVLRHLTERHCHQMKFLASLNTLKENRKESL